MELSRDEEVGVFAPDPVELELWSDEVRRARNEYYLSPGPHRTYDYQPRLAASRIHPRVHAGPVRQALQEALDDLQAERFRSASMRRLITRLQRQIIELEIRVGDRDEKGAPVSRLWHEGPHDGETGYGVLLAPVRAGRPCRQEAKDKETEGKVTWTQ